MNAIPSSVNLLGHTIVVTRIPMVEWPHGDDCVGIYDPLNQRIDLLAEYDGSRGLHTFMHELLHAALMVMNHKLAFDEKFVDTLGGLLAQALFPAQQTMKKKVARKRPSKKGKA